jgi:P27 family predicted phage terminase small subunit
MKPAEASRSDDLPSLADVLDPPREPKGSASKPPPAPRHLTRRAKDFWRKVTRAHELGAHQVEILRRACEQIDRADQARAVIATEGVTIKDRFDQTKDHPCVAIERQAHVTLARLLRELNLEPPPPDPRPPTLAYGG